MPDRQPSQWNAVHLTQVGAMLLALGVQTYWIGNFLGGITEHLTTIDRRLITLEGEGSTALGIIRSRQQINETRIDRLEVQNVQQAEAISSNREALQALKERVGYMLRDRTPP